MDLADMPSLARRASPTQAALLPDDSVPLPPGADDSRNAISDVGLMIMANPNRIRENPVPLSEASEEIIRAPTPPPAFHPLADRQQAGDNDDRLFVDGPSTVSLNSLRKAMRSTTTDNERTADNERTTVADEFTVPEEGLYGAGDDNNNNDDRATSRMPAAAGVMSDSNAPFIARGNADEDDFPTHLPPFPSFSTTAARQGATASSSGNNNVRNRQRAEAAAASERRERLRQREATPVPPNLLARTSSAGGGGGDAVTASQQQPDEQQRRTDERRTDEKRDDERRAEERGAESNAGASARKAKRDREQERNKERAGAANNDDGAESGDTRSSKRRTEQKSAEREQSFAEFEAEIQRQAKEQEDTEKREMILLFYEKQNVEKIRVPAKFLGEDAMNCDLHEMRWWYYKLVRDTRIHDAVGGMKQTIVQITRGALIMNNTIGNPLNLRLDANFPTELASVLNNKLDRHLRDYVKSKCGISGPKPNPMRQIFQGIFETAWTYHRNRVALENSEKKAAQRQESNNAAQYQQQQQQQQQFQMFNPARMFGQQPLFPQQGQPLQQQQMLMQAGIDADEWQQFLHWKQMAAARQQQQQQQQQHQHQQQNAVNHPLAQSQMYGNGVPRPPQWRAPAVPAEQPAAPSLPAASGLAPPSLRSFAVPQKPLASQAAAAAANQPPLPPQRPPAFATNRKPLQNALRHMAAADRQAPLHADLRPPTIPRPLTTAAQPTTGGGAPSPGLRGDMSLIDAAHALQADLQQQQQQQQQPQPQQKQQTNVQPQQQQQPPHTIQARRVVHGAPPPRPALLQQQHAAQQQTESKKTLINPVLPLRSVPAPTAQTTTTPRLQPPQRPAALNRPLASAVPQLGSTATLAKKTQPALPVEQQYRPLGNTLGQIDVRSRATAPKTYADLLADLETAANASRQQHDEAGMSHDDLAYAPNSMPEISMHDKIGDTLTLLEDVMNPPPKQEFQPVIVDVDDILGKKKTASSAEGQQRSAAAPIMSLEQVRRLKQQRADSLQMSASSSNNAATASGDHVRIVEQQKKTVTTTTGAAARKRRKAGGSVNQDDAPPVRIVREPESPAVRFDPTATHNGADDDEQQPKTPTTPPLVSGGVGSGKGGSAMRSQTRTGNTRFTF